MTSTSNVPRSRTSFVDPPLWVRVAAHTAALTPLPSALWRISLIFGLSGGFTEQGLVDLDVAGWGWLYLLGLSLVTEFFALLTLGLIKQWGEVLPRWVPLVGGRLVPTVPVVSVALTGAALLTFLWTPLLFWWSTPHPDMTPTGANVVGFLYLPLVAWGPLLAAVTISYALRRRHAADNPHQPLQHH